MISTLPETSRSTISWFRAAEIKHGRVAMAAFVGFIVGENKIHFPWALQGGPDPLTYADLANVGGACAQWDAVPTLGKLQILGAVGLLEIWSECSGTHYMAPGGKPGCVAPSAPHRERSARTEHCELQGWPCLPPPSTRAAVASALAQHSRDAAGQGVGLGVGQGFDWRSGSWVGAGGEAERGAARSGPGGSGPTAQTSCL